jgi:Escherichia/Staphylococcus phage prohead protease
MELRAAADKPTISGYAAVFNSNADFGGGFTESVHPNAFNRALADKQDVKALFNHDANIVLGRTKSGTLRLSTDNTGLYFETDVNENDPQAMAVRAMIQRGDVDQCSFSFRCQQDQMSSLNWKRQDLSRRYSGSTLCTKSTMSS